MNRSQLKYVKACRNQERLEAFGFIESGMFVRRARQQRRFNHWGKVAANAFIKRKGWLLEWRKVAGV